VKRDSVTRGRGDAGSTLSSGTVSGNVTSLDFEVCVMDFIIGYNKHHHKGSNSDDMVAPARCQ
jgi:hypothetical protein